MTDFIVVGIILLLVIGVLFHIWKCKKTGNGSSCGCGGSCTGCKGHCNSNH